MRILVKKIDVIITSITGGLGSYLARKFIENGYRVAVFAKMKARLIH